jgi:hypothetical protein
LANSSFRVVDLNLLVGIVRIRHEFCLFNKL